MALPIVFLQALILLSLQCYQSLTSTVTKSVILTANNPSQNNATIHLLKDVTTSISNKWMISATDQIGFHLKLSLNPTTWSFHKTRTTSLTIEIGSDSIISGDPRKLLTTFSQSNTSYLSTLTSIDNIGDHKIYPICDTKKPYQFPIATGNIFNIISNITNSNSNIDRFSKISKDTISGTFLPSTSSPNTAYPLIFKLENDPFDNNIVFTYTNPGVAARSCGYTAMSTDTSLDLYFAVNQQGQDFDIEYINITHSIQETDVSHTNKSESNDNDNWYGWILALETILITALFLCCLVVLFLYCCRWKRKYNRKQRDRNLAFALQMATSPNIDVQDFDNFSYGNDTRKSGRVQLQITDENTYKNTMDDKKKKKKEEMEEVEDESDDQFEDDDIGINNQKETNDVSLRNGHGSDILNEVKLDDVQRAMDDDDGNDNNDGVVDISVEAD